MVKSPCDRVCTTEQNQCTYCGRTVPEIVNWQNLTEEEKQEIIQEIKQNRNTDKNFE